MSHLPSVAVVGLGSMGLGMARSLVRAGHAVRGFDISADALNALEAAGGVIATAEWARRRGPDAPRG